MGKAHGIILNQFLYAESLFDVIYMNFKFIDHKAGRYLNCVYPGKWFEPQCRMVKVHKMMF